MKTTANHRSSPLVPQDILSCFSKAQDALDIQTPTEPFPSSYKTFSTGRTDLIVNGLGDPRFTYSVASQGLASLRQWIWYSQRFRERWVYVMIGRTVLANFVLEKALASDNATIGSSAGVSSATADDVSTPPDTTSIAAS